MAPGNNLHLKAAIELACSVKVYVPSTVDVDTAADTKEWVDTWLSTLSRMFGGATSTPAIGAWVSEGGKLVKENVTIVFTYCNQVDLMANIDEVVERAEQMGHDLRQEAVALEVNNKLYLL